jgi:hypothetical protein
MLFATVLSLFISTTLVDFRTRLSTMAPHDPATSMPLNAAQKDAIEMKLADAAAPTTDQFGFILSRYRAAVQEADAVPQAEQSEQGDPIYHKGSSPPQGGEQVDEWTMTADGCTCYDLRDRHDCACCISPAVQCGISLKKERCVPQGQGKLCVASKLLRRKVRKRRIKSYRRRQTRHDDAIETLFKMVTTEINYGCKAQRHVGGVDQGEEGATGGSPVCFDGQLSKLDTEAAEGRVDGIDNGPGGDCRVFSVGSAENAAGTNRVAFVKAMIAGGAHGCSLDVMDPSIKRSNKSESAVIKSHPWLGLGVTDDKDTRNDVLPSLGHEGHEGTGSVRLLSLKTLMPLLGARKLALLKLDLDGGELAILESLLKAKGSPLQSVEQLVVEVHLWHETYNMTCFVNA